MNKMDVIILYRHGFIQYLIGFYKAVPYYESEKYMKKLKELDKAYVLIVASRLHKTRKTSK